MDTDLEEVIEQEATSFEAQDFAESTEQVEAGEPVSKTEQPIEHPSTEQVAHDSAKHEEASPDATSHADTAAAPEPVTVLTAGDFAALEERILRAVSLVKREREARTLAEGKVAALEAQKEQLEAQSAQFEAQRQALEAQLREHQEQSPVLERLEREVESLRAEREQVRQRVERLLGQLDALQL